MLPFHFFSFHLAQGGSVLFDSSFFSFLTKFATITISSLSSCRLVMMWNFRFMWTLILASKTLCGLYRPATLVFTIRVFAVILRSSLHTGFALRDPRLVVRIATISDDTIVSPIPGSLEIATRWTLTVLPQFRRSRVPPDNWCAGCGASYCSRIDWICYCLFSSQVLIVDCI